MKAARGIRNNNPMNLVHVETNKWQGLADPPSDGRLCVFIDPVKGIRAGIVNFIGYYDRHGCRTLREFIAKWAPWSENPTDKYIQFVFDRTGIDPAAMVNPHLYEHIRPIVPAMIEFENGYQPYSDSQIDKALAMAGVLPETPRSLQSSRTVKGGQVAAATGAAATVAGALETIAPALPVLDWARDNLGTVLIVGGIVILAAVGYMIWARIDDRNRGLR